MCQIWHHLVVRIGIAAVQALQLNKQGQASLFILVLSGSGSGSGSSSMRAGAALLSSSVGFTSELQPRSIRLLKLALTSAARIKWKDLVPSSGKTHRSAFYRCLVTIAAFTGPTRGFTRGLTSAWAGTHRSSPPNLDPTTMAGRVLIVTSTPAQNSRVDPAALAVIPAVTSKAHTFDREVF